MTIRTPPAPNEVPAAKPIESWSKKLATTLSTWVLSLVFMIAVPSIPLLIEAAKNAGDIRPESYYLTAAVLGASYGIASRHNIFRSAYALIFIAAIVADFQPATGPSWVATSWAQIAMFVVAGVQSIERFSWHVVLNYAFPDWLGGQ